MAVVNATALNRIYQNLRKDFQGAYEAVDRLWPAFAMEVPSSARSNLYHWLSDLPQVREWFGPRIAKDLATRSWEAVNRDWELTIKLLRNDLADDMEGAVATAQQRALQSGEEFSYHEDSVMATTIEDGLTKTCFDGQFFFDTDHPQDPDNAAGTTFSNKLTATALTHANFASARRELMKFKRENALPVAPPRKLLLLVPPDLETTARSILNLEFVAPTAAVGGNAASVVQSNVSRGLADLQVNPYLTSATRWFLLNVGQRVKPLVFQRRQPVQLTRKDRADDDNVFERKEYLYGADARYTGTYSFPHLAISSDA